MAGVFLGDLSPLGPLNVHCEIPTPNSDAPGAIDVTTPPHKYLFDRVLKGGKIGVEESNLFFFLIVF